MSIDKRDTVLKVLMTGTAFIHVDPCVENVHVPSRFSRQRQVVLQIGYDMPVPIPDLHIDERGWTGTLSFKGTPFHVSIPWTSVFCVVNESGRGKIWAEDMPPSIAEEVERLNAPQPILRSRKEIASEAVVSLAEYRTVRDQHR